MWSSLDKLVMSHLWNNGEEIGTPGAQFESKKTSVEHILEPEHNIAVPL
jgi:hypothetical protein